MLNHFLEVGSITLQPETPRTRSQLNPAGCKRVFEVWLNRYVNSSVSLLL